MSRTLSNLKVKDLKHLAFLTGCQLSITKAGLQQSLLNRIGNPLIDNSRPRVVSVDMGIRNLAYCVVSVDEQDGEQRTVGRDKHARIINRVSISHWQKIDLVAQLQAITSSPTSSVDDALHSTDEKVVHGAHDSSQLQNAGIFTPPVISQIALSFVQLLLEHRPSTILIERQRFRSGGGSAIQEWTVRVNMLESMLWACLATVKKLSKLEGQAFPTVHSVEPARVAKFWTAASKLSPDFDLEAGNTLDGGDVALAEKQSKITKAQRIAILKAWIANQSDGLTALTFTDQAKQIVEAFTSSRSRPKGNGHVGKLDDLTDCLLQAMAWVRWEANRQHINVLLDTSDKPHHQ